MPDKAEGPKESEDNPNSLTVPSKSRRTSVQSVLDLRFMENQKTKTILGGILRRSSIVPDTFQQPVRKTFATIVAHPYFNVVIMVIILVNCVFLALDHPSLESQCLKPSARCTTYEWVLFISNIVFTVIFVLEMLLILTVKGPQVTQLSVIHSCPLISSGAWKTTVQQAYH